MKRAGASGAGLVEATKVFVSYSRQDAAIVDRLVAALEARGAFQILRDVDDILPTEEWRSRLEDLIAAADTVVFCVSPQSARSEVCAWEVGLAERLGKRIAPLLVRKTDDPVPAALARLNYILATPERDFDQAVDGLVEALETDIAWIREHTHLGMLARRWEASGQLRDAFLRGTAVDAAENWLKYKPRNAPPLTALTAHFISASRLEQIATTRRNYRIRATLTSLALTLIGVVALAYAGFLDAVYLEGRWNGVRNRRVDATMMPGDIHRDCTAPACPDMVLLPTGSFVMGSPDNEAERTKDEGPLRTVTIAKPILVARYEVTFEQWDECYRAGGCTIRPDDRGWGRGGRPVINVSWNDAQRYLTWLSIKTGMTYRLLTEAEWEYAARSVTRPDALHPPYAWGPAFAVGIAQCVACENEIQGRTIEVGSFPPNRFGLYDMTGNVWEWVRDCHTDDYTGAPVDGSASEETANCRRVMRGGAYSTGAKFLRSAYRSRQLPGQGYSNVGFRVARDQTVPAK